MNFRHKKLSIFQFLTSWTVGICATVTVSNTAWYCNKIRKRSNDGEWISFKVDPTAKYKLSKKGEGKKQKPPFLQPIVSQQSCLSDFV